MKMLVNPVLSYPANNYKNINFAAKKKDTQENSNQRSSTSSLKAVPLAALVAMSPLNTANINASAKADINEIYVENVQEDKASKYGVKIGYDEFGSNKFSLNYGGHIVYYGDKKGSKDIKKISIAVDDIRDFGGNVKGIGKLKVQVIGDDKRKAESFEIPYVMYEDKDNGETRFTDEPAVCTILEKVVDGKDARFNRCDIPRLPATTLNVRMLPSGELTSNFPIIDLYSRMYVSEKLGNVTDIYKVPRTDGGYIYLHLIDTDGNPETFEKAAVSETLDDEKQRYAEVDGIHCSMITVSPNNLHVRPTVVLKQNRLNLKACITDNNLMRALLELSLRKAFNNAYKSEIYNCKVLLKPKEEHLDIMNDVHRVEGSLGTGAFQFLE